MGGMGTSSATTWPKSLFAAVILWIAVVIRDPFAAQVIVSTQFRYFLWAAVIAAVVIRQAFILAQE
jgi:hypothetical protein